VDVSQPWTLDQMAKQCGMGVTAFSKYCREVVNSGPMEFLNHCRLNRAARMLREETIQSITDVAFACGFNSSQYFATRFRQRFQISPRQFLNGATASALARLKDDRGLEMNTATGK
jgi:AraC family L-rhamnose operon regulatory protein RhaS